MYAFQSDMSNSSASSILLKAKRFGIFSIFAITANIFTIPQAAYSQIAVDGSTATEVKGNVISPTGSGTVNGGNLYNSFQEFNVPTNGVIFNTGNSSVDGSKINNLINRVTGENPSSILGTIESRQAFPNANLYLLNPNGVIFSPNARLDIGGSFNVSTGTGLGFDQNQKFTVDKNSLSFPSGDPKNIQFAISQPAGIINQGNLSVDAGKNIAITAGTVINAGNLTAPNGNVSLAAVAGNSQVELRSPDIVLGLSVSPNTIPSTWNGQIATLPKLAEALTGKVDQASQVVVKPDGSIALVVSPSASDITVKDGMAIASGNINVSSEITKGGNVGIFGNQVGLVNAQINASGATGGGTVLIGGDFQGKGIAPNALQTYVDASSKILANGLLTGDGGKVIIWADRSTQFFGAIAARGGDISGNGGFVEVSGKDNLIYQGSTDTLAPNGKIGTLLLDPQNIEVTFGSNIPAELAANDQFADPPALGTSFISNATINNATSNVVLQATNNINFNAPINIAASGVGLTAQAGNSIVSDGFGNGTITTNGGNVSLTANDNTFGSATNLGNITINSAITTNGGAVDIKTSSSPGFGNSSILINAEINSTGGINITGGAINILGSGIGNSDGISLNAGIVSNGGVIKIQGNSDSIGINAPITSNGGAIDIETTDSSIQVRGNLSSGTGNINVIGNGQSTGIQVNNSAKISTTSGTITLNGTNKITPDRTGLSIIGDSSVEITSISGNINLIGNVLNTSESRGIEFLSFVTPSASVSASNSVKVQTTTGNINITGNTANPNGLGIRIPTPITTSPIGALTIDSGSGNLTFISDKSLFPTTSFTGSGTIALQPFSNNPLVINSGITNASGSTTNVFADSSFFNTLAASPSFSNIVIGSATTSNPITVTTPITLTNSLQINSNNGAIAFNNTIDGNQNLTVNSGTGNITFNGAIGSTTVLGNIIANSSGITIFNSTVNAGSLTTDAVGTTELNSNITTSGLQTYNDAVSLLNSVQLNTTNSAIAFNNTVNGNQDLTVNTGTGDITFGNAVGSPTALGNLTANSTGTTRFNSTVNAASLTTNTGGTTELNGNVTTTGAQTYNDTVTLTSAIQASTTNSAIAFNNTVNGTQNLTVNSGSANINFNGAVGDSAPLANLLISSTGLVRFASSLNADSLTISGATLSSNGNITTTGNIVTGNINNSSSPLFLTSNSGSITTGNLNSGNGSNVTVDANNDVNTGNIATDSASFTGGNILLRSRTGQIVAGNVNTSGNIGGSVFFDASTAIAVGAINSSGTTRAGDVTLDPLGDVVVSSIDASSPVQAGNVTLISTGGGLRITDLINSSSSSACIGSSICTSGAIAGNISLQTGGVSSFIVGDSSINGSTGILTTGSTTIQLGTTIQVRLGSKFTQGQISISPGFNEFPSPTPEPEPTPPFLPPPKTGGPTPPPPEVIQNNIDECLKGGNLGCAVGLSEQKRNDELNAFTGKKTERARITIENTQELLSTVAQQTGDVAAIIYPILLENRIEILLIPPLEKGNVFRAIPSILNQESVQAIITEYRNNLRDVGSNDYLEQSQKLYDWIIRPVEKKLEELKIDTLVFVMDGDLRVSPPAAFHDGKQFLIERYAIANIPTLRALRIEQRDRKTTRVLAMGLTEAVEGFSALPSVDIEIKTISSEFLNGVSLLNQDFTVNNLQKQRQGGTFNILHLGTHAKFVSDTSKDSFIQFWDSRLKLSEIPQLRFDNPAIDMLALSACQTAVGNNLGISGLAVESGAKSVLASLWEVSDAGTAPLMISFYKAFPDAVNKAQAMKTAQLALLGGKVKIGDSQILGIEGFPSIPLPAGLSDIDLSHPFYWSSFILVGNWL